MTLNEVREELDRLYGLPPSPLVELEIGNLSLLYHELTKRDSRKHTVRISITQVGGNEDERQECFSELRGSE